MSSNPYLEKYADRLSKSKGLYPPRDAMVFWNRDSRDHVKDVEVIYLPDCAPGAGKDPDTRADFMKHTKGWASDLAIDDENSPAGIFGFLLEAGFSSRAETKRALKAFTKIEGCDWATEMVGNFHD